MGLVQTITKSTLKDCILYHSKSEKDTPMDEKKNKVMKTKLQISLHEEDNNPSYYLFFDGKPIKKLTIDEVVVTKFDLYNAKKVAPPTLKNIILQIANIYEQPIQDTAIIIQADELSKNGEEIKKLKLFLRNKAKIVREITFDEILPNL